MRILRVRGQHGKFYERIWGATLHKQHYFNNYEFHPKMRAKSGHEYIYELTLYWGRHRFFTYISFPHFFRRRKKLTHKV